MTTVIRSSRKVEQITFKVFEPHLRRILDASLREEGALSTDYTLLSINWSKLEGEELTVEAVYEKEI